MYQMSALRAKSQRVMEMLDRQIDRLKQHPIDCQPNPIAKPPIHRRRGDNAALILSALLKHHDYAKVGILKWEPIGVRDLAKQVGCSPATVTRWFAERFPEGYQGYLIHIKSTRLAVDLRLLSGDCTPRYVDLTVDAQGRVSSGRAGDETDD